MLFITVNAHKYSEEKQQSRKISDVNSVNFDLSDDEMTSIDFTCTMYID